MSSYKFIRNIDVCMFAYMHMDTYVYVFQVC